MARISLDDQITGLREEIAQLQASAGAIRKTLAEKQKELARLVADKRHREKLEAGALAQQAGVSPEMLAKLLADHLKKQNGGMKPVAQHMAGTDPAGSGSVEKGEKE